MERASRSRAGCRVIAREIKLFGSQDERGLHDLQIPAVYHTAKNIAQSTRRPTYLHAKYTPVKILRKVVGL